MKPFHKKITYFSSYSFSINREEPPEFDTPWHYHPEFELNYIQGSRGTRFMGDNISEFTEYELTLVGSNLPHFWKEDENCPPTIKNYNPSAIVIHFNKSFLGSDFFERPEFSKINELLEHSKRGITFSKKTALKVHNRMNQIVDKPPFERVMLLLEVLHILTQEKKINKLASNGFVNFFAEKKSEKINSIYEYTMSNFKNRITLEEVASLVFMTKESFCRYFKNNTGKTYFDFLIEVRIGYACKLLQQGYLTVSQIGYECGYTNLTNFNRQFKKVVGLKPLEFQKEHNFSEA